jgi:hypothetical protein
LTRNVVAIAGAGRLITGKYWDCPTVCKFAPAGPKSLDPRWRHAIPDLEGSTVAGDDHGAFAVVVFVHLQQICASISYFVALGLFVPTYPDLEPVQQFIRVMATNVENLHVNRANVAFRPVDYKSRPASPCGSRHDHHHHEDYY